MTPEEIIASEKQQQETAPLTPESIVAREKGLRTSAARGSLRSARDMAPDQAAQVVDLASRRGMDFEFAWKNRETLQKEDQQSSTEALLSRSPKLSESLADPGFAAVSHDSLEQLAGIEQTIRDTKSERAAGNWIMDYVSRKSRESQVRRLMVGQPFDASDDMTREEAEKAYDEFLKTSGEVVRGAPDAAKAAGPALLEGMYGLLAAGDKMFPTPTRDGGYISLVPGEDAVVYKSAGERDLAAAKYFRTQKERMMPTSEDPTANAILSGVTSLSQNAPWMAAGAMARRPEIALGGMSAGVTGQEYARGVEAGLTHEQALTFGIGQGAIEYLTEKLPMETLLGGKVGKDITHRFIVSMVQEQVGEQAATFGQDFLDWRVLNPEKTQEQFMAERLDAAYQTAIATFVATAGTNVVILGTEAATRQRKGKEQETGATVEALGKLREAIEQTPAFARQRESVSDFIEQATEGESILLDDEGMVQLYQSSPEAFAMLMEHFGVDPAEAYSGALKGSDVQVSAAKLLTLPERTDYDALVDIARTSPDALTPAEIRSQAENDVLSIDMQDLRARLEDEQMALEGFERVQQQVQQQLLDAGRSPEESEAAGVIWGSVFRILAEDGVNEAQVFEQLGLRVENAGQKGGRTAAMPEPQSQEPKDQRDQADTETLNQSLGEALEGSPEYERAVAKGLDMSQSARMQRARDMGFDTDTVLYHGTFGDVRAFDLSAPKRSDSGFHGDGIYLAVDPAVASDYAGAGKYALGDGRRMADMLLRKKRPGDKFGNVMPVYVRGKVVSTADTNATLKDFPDADALRVKYPGGHEEVVVRAPSNIRSVNAAFDPDVADSPNLLYQGGALDFATPEGRSAFVDEYVEQDTIPGETAASRTYGYRLSEDLAVTMDINPMGGVATVTWDFIGNTGFSKLGRRLTTDEARNLYGGLLAIFERDIAEHQRDAYLGIPFEDMLRTRYMNLSEQLKELGYDTFEQDGEIYFVHEDADIAGDGTLIPSGRPQAEETPDRSEDPQEERRSSFFSRVGDRDIPRPARGRGQSGVGELFQSGLSREARISEDVYEDVVGDVSIEVEFDGPSTGKQVAMRVTGGRIKTMRSARDVFAATYAALADHAERYQSDEYVFSGKTGGHIRMFERQLKKSGPPPGYSGVIYNPSGNRVMFRLIRNDVFSAAEWASQGGEIVRSAQEEAEIPEVDMQETDPDTLVLGEKDRVLELTDIAESTAKQRAASMGFDTDLVLYHGTKEKFDAFDLKRAGDRAGPLDTEAIYFVKDRDIAWNWSGRGEGDVIPVFLRIKNPLVIHSDHPAVKPDREDGIRYDPLPDDLIGQAKNDGYDAVIFKQVDDGGMGISDYYVVFDPANIRNIYANFDKTKANSPRLMDQPGKRASVQIPGVMEGAPGSAILSDRNVIVRLSSAADKTSFLHESAHIFLELYGALESQNKAVAQRMAEIRKFLGLKEGAPLTREQHELFAETFEAYLMEGKSPNAELKGVFRKFRAWFTEVYRRLRGKLPKLNQEARDIFDRMLATEDEIEAARSEYGMQLSSKMAGMMTPEQVAKYQKYAEQAGQVAQDKLFRKHMEQVQKRTRRAYRAERERVEALVRKELENRGVYRALKDHSDDGKTLRDSVEADIIAPDYGFATGDELLKAIRRAPKYENAVKAETKRRMDELHGDMLTDGTAEAEAIAAVFNEPSIKAMEAERDALALKAAKQGIPLRAIRARAEQMINSVPIDEIITPGKYAIKARDLHKRAIRAAAQEKWDDALRYTHQAMLQHELARRAYNARDEVARINRYLARYAAHRKLDPKQIDPRYIAQIRNLVSLPGADNQQDTMQKLRDFSDREANEGLPIILPTDVVLNRPLPMRRRMSMEQLRELRDGVRNLVKVGRDQSAETAARRRAEFNALAEGIQQNAGDKHLRGRFDADDKSFLLSFSASLRKLPFLLRVLDGGPDTFGPMYKAVMLPLREAGGRELDLKYENEVRLNEILRKYELNLSRRVSVDAFGGENMKIEQLLVLALNMGNEQNIARLLKDPNFKFTEQNIQAALDEHLTKDHWDAAQEIWDFVNSRWPEIAELEKRTTGVAPTKVEARPVQTRFGTYAGGYYPLKYDPGFQKGGAVRDQLATEFDAKVVQGGVMGRTQTKHGHTIARQQNVSRSVWLDLGGLVQHLDEVAHDLAYREAFNTAATILNDSTIGQAIQDAIGKENLMAMREIVERIATGQIKPRNHWERMMRTLRVNAAAADLGLNARTILTQPLGVTQSMAKLGAGTFAQGTVEYLTDMPGSLEMIMEKSAFMRNRAKIVNRDVRDAISGEKSRGIINRARGYALLPMQLVDVMGVAAPTWLAAYRQHLDETGNEKESILYADGIVADTQGSGLIMDLSTIQSGTELEKIFSYMYSYFATTLNLTYEAGQIARRQPARATAMLLMLYTIPGVLAEVVLNGMGGDDDDDLETRFLKTALMGHINQASATLPGFRDLVSAFRYNSGQETFFGRLVSGIARTSTSAAKAIGEGDADAANRTVVNGIRTGGVLLGIPGAGQLARLYQTVTQDDDPTIVEAILTGPDDDN